MGWLVDGHGRDPISHNSLIPTKDKLIQDNPNVVNLSHSGMPPRRNPLGRLPISAGRRGSCRLDMQFETRTSGRRDALFNQLKLTKHARLDSCIHQHGVENLTFNQLKRNHQASAAFQHGGQDEPDMILQPEDVNPHRPAGLLCFGVVPEAKARHRIIPSYGYMPIIMSIVLVNFTSDPTYPMPSLA